MAESQAQTTRGSEPNELVDGLWRWTRRHPEWHPGEFGAEVASYAVVAGDELLLIDPLVLLAGDEGVDEDDPAEALIDRLVARTTADGTAPTGGRTARTVSILITVGYHVRSAERLAHQHGASIHAPLTAGNRLADRSLLDVVDPGTPGPGGSVAFAFGHPARSERPLWLPSHRAVVFGDMVVRTPEGRLALWESRIPHSADRLAFYRDRFVPTFEPLLEQPIDHVLTTHGEPVIGDGGQALRDALSAEPWFYID